MKNRKLFCNISLLLCAAFIVASPIRGNAEEHTDEEPIYYDTEYGRFVNNPEEYLSQLNNGMITPYAPTIKELEAEISLYSIVHEPSNKCSNIFGHQWDDWDNWQEGTIIHSTSGPCILGMERFRKCTRTHCGATQRETDSVFLYSCHGK